MRGCATERRSGIPDESELLEREAELVRLAEVISGAASGAGRVAVIRGPAGIGKTSLLRAARAVADDAGARVLSARGSDLEKELSYGVVRQLFERPLARAATPGRRRLLAGAARHAQAALRIEGAESPTRADHGFAVLHGLYWLTSNLSERRPLLIAVDDGHWADIPSQRFLAYLATRVQDLRVAIVLTLRTDEPASLLGRLGVEPIVPAPLSEEAVAALVREVLGPAAEDPFCRACHATSGGNPFFVRELVNEFAAEGLEPTAKNATHVRDAAPATVSHAVLVRLARLPRSGLALARALAILGGEAESREAATLAGLSRSDASHAVDSLRGAGMLEQGRPLRFAHPIVRTAVYAELPAGERESGHRRAAELLAADGRPPERVAAHLFPLEPSGDAWVAETLLRAADAARRSGALEPQTRYLERALAEPPPEAHRSAILLALGAAEADLGRPAAVLHLREALTSTQSSAEQALAARALAGVLAVAGRIDEAAAVIDATIARATPEAARMLEVEFLSYLHQSGTGARQVPIRLKRLRATARGRMVADHLLLVEVAWQSALRGEAVYDTVRLARRGRDALQLLGSPFDTPLFYQVAYTFTLADRYDLAESMLEEALVDAQAAGSARAFAVASVWRSHLFYRRGNVRGAEADAVASLDASREHGWALGQAWSLAFLIDALVELGELDRAQDELARDFPDEELPEGLPFNHLLESRAGLRLAQARPSDALRDAVEFRRREQYGRARNPACSAHRSRAATALSLLGQRDRALRLTREEVVRARRFGAQRAIGLALATHGLVLGGRHGIAHLREAVGVLEGSHARLEHARAIVHLGAAVRRAGRRSDARDLLRRGLEIAEGCGAAAVRARSREELLALGVRVARRASADRDELTPSERRVAELAAKGLSNREVAQSLFVSLKTVEMHLSRTYRKLGLRSRAQLHAALGSPRH